MTQPLDCPWCSSVNIAREGFHMSCLHCGADGPDGDHETDESAAIAWNNRAANSESPSAANIMALADAWVVAAIHKAFSVHTGCSTEADPDAARGALRSALASSQTAAKPGEPSRSQKMRDAGYTPRPSPFGCEECGRVFGGVAQLQAHDCTKPGEQP